jgi:hypothetical protein
VRPRPSGQVRQDQILQRDIVNHPYWTDRGAIGPYQQVGLLLGVRGLDHRGHPGDVGLVGAPRADQCPVRGQQLVDRAQHLHPRGVQDDEVVADPFQVAHQVRGEQHGRALLGDRPHQHLQELAAGQRVETGHRLVQQQDVRPFGQCEGERDLGPLPAGELAGPPVRRNVEAL